MNDATVTIIICHPLANYPVRMSWSSIRLKLALISWLLMDNLQATGIYRSPESYQLIPNLASKGEYEVRKYFPYNTWLDIWTKFMLKRAPAPPYYVRVSLTHICKILYLGQVLLKDFSSVFNVLFKTLYWKHIQNVLLGIPVSQMDTMFSGLFELCFILYIILKHIL